MPPQQESGVHYYARKNLQLALGFAVMCLTILIFVEAAGFRPPGGESGLWWEIPAWCICGVSLLKTGR